MTVVRRLIQALLLQVILGISLFAPVSAQTTESTSPPNYSQLNQKILSGRATLAQVRQALTEKNPASLSNTIHALYKMRWHRGVQHLLTGMWGQDKEKYPEISWQHITVPPARIALASTLNRINVVNAQEYQNYIRSQQYHKHEFVRAQVTVALGMNGNPDDLPYLQEMASSDNHYVVQSAITALAMSGGPQSQAVLETLDEKFDGTPRGTLIHELLTTAFYNRH